MKGSDKEVEVYDRYLISIIILHLNEFLYIIYFFYILRILFYFFNKISKFLIYLLMQFPFIDSIRI